MNSKKDDIIITMGNLFAIFEENAVATEMASAEQQTGLVAAIANAREVLARESELIMRNIRKFKY